MKPFLAVVGFAVAVSLGACTTSPLPPSARPAGSSGEQPSFSQFSDVPIPAKATMDVDHSLLLGNGENWVGRLVYSTGGSTSGIYDLYKSDMPGFGWQEITSVRAAISIQTWQRGDRVATIQIRDTTFGCEVILTVAPTMGGAGGGGPSYAPAPVGRQPVR